MANMITKAILAQTEVRIVQVDGRREFEESLVELVIAIDRNRHGFAEQQIKAIQLLVTVQVR